ncbi:MAG: hypothetical protein HY872_10150, partial [Chloroflexi bacterium]|nr:hypothetical protein [Chloroflexota bacterium]
MKWAGRILLGLEISIVLGVGLAIALAARTLTAINQQSAVAQYTALAPTATALIRLAELPAGNHGDHI